MAENPGERSRFRITDLDDPEAARAAATAEAESRARFRRRAVAALAVVALAGVALSPFVLRAWSREGEKRAAVAAAVGRYSDLLNEPVGRVYHYREIKARRLGGGAWRVDISRVVVDDPKAGWKVTSKFRVDRGGKTEYLGQDEGRGH